MNCLKSQFFLFGYLGFTYAMVLELNERRRKRQKRQEKKWKDHQRKEEPYMRSNIYFYMTGLWKCITVQINYKSFVNLRIVEIKDFWIELNWIHDIFYSFKKYDRFCMYILMKRK